LTFFNFSKKIFIPFHISTYKIKPPSKHPNFRIKSEGSSNYRGTSFFPIRNSRLKMNNETPKKLEFIQTTRSSRGRAKSPRPRRQVKKDRKRSCCYVENIFCRQRRHLALQTAAVEWVVWIHSTNKFVRIFNLFMQNEPKFPRFSPKNDDLIKKRTQTNPNKPNTKPKKANFRKAKTNAFSRKACAIGRSFTMIITILQKFTPSLSPSYCPLGQQQGNGYLLASLSGIQ
jgi:hypothetical protein